MVGAAVPPEPTPEPQELGASRVVSGMAVFGRGRVTELTAPRTLVLAILAGGSITAGALFSEGLLAVTLFVAARFQHSPANMGFFSPHIAHGGDLAWTTALAWDIVPAGIGNMVGAATLLAIPSWYVFCLSPGGRDEVLREVAG